MKRFNLDEFLWFITLLLIEYSLIYLISTQKIIEYIEDNMVKYFYLGIVMIGVLVLFQIKNIFIPKANTNIKRKLLPVIIALILGGISILQ